MAFATGAVSTIVAALLLLGSIVSLRHCKDENVQLVVIATFTCGFAVSVSGLTTARRAEVFGASAAYAAVLVVFLSPESSSCTCPDSNSIGLSFSTL